MTVETIDIKAREAVRESETKPNLGFALVLIPWVALIIGIYFLSSMTSYQP